jgi:hypothetical protein
MYSEDTPPWEMQGSFLTDISLIKGLTIQQGMWHCCALRLALLFDSPIEVKHRIIADGQPFLDSNTSLAFGTEWRFLLALHFIRTDRMDARIQEVRDHLLTMPLSTLTTRIHWDICSCSDSDYAKCVEIIDCLLALEDDLFRSIATLDRLSADLEPTFGNLHGESTISCRL